MLHSRGAPSRHFCFNEWKFTNKAGICQEKNLEKTNVVCEEKSWRVQAAPR